MRRTSETILACSPLISSQRCVDPQRVQNSTDHQLELSTVQTIDLEPSRDLLRSVSYCQRLAELRTQRYSKSLVGQAQLPIVLRIVSRARGEETVTGKRLGNSHCQQPGSLANQSTSLNYKGISKIWWIIARYHTRKYLTHLAPDDNRPLWKAHPMHSALSSRSHQKK